MSNASIRRNIARLAAAVPVITGADWATHEARGRERAREECRIYEINGETEMRKLRVQRRQCTTCIFRPEYWSPSQLAKLLDEIRDQAMNGHFRGHRICHHSSNAVCAGFWARYRNHFDNGQIAQRLNLVAFVNDDTLK